MGVLTLVTSLLFMFQGKDDDKNIINYLVLIKGRKKEITFCGRTNHDIFFQQNTKRAMLKWILYDNFIMSFVYKSNENNT